MLAVPSFQPILLCSFFFPERQSCVVISLCPLRRSLREKETSETVAVPRFGHVESRIISLPSALQAPGALVSCFPAWQCLCNPDRRPENSWQECIVFFRLLRCRNETSERQSRDSRFWGSTKYIYFTDCSLWLCLVCRLLECLANAGPSAVRRKGLC